MKKKLKSSAALPIGSYTWALARLNEVGRDPYALKIKLDHDIPAKGAITKKLKI